LAVGVVATTATVGVLSLASPSAPPPPPPPSLAAPAPPRPLRPAEPVTPPKAPAEPTDVEPSPPPPAVEPPSVNPRPSRPTAPRGDDADAASEATPGSTLSEQSRLLQEARGALAAGDANAAEAVLGAYTRRFGRGALAEEHDALAAITACRARPRSAEVAERFRRIHPRSPFLGRVEQACRVK
ncbi:MAG: hypothetical protein AAGA56_21060, partial [Myxococcota bacterium]